MRGKATSAAAGAHAETEKDLHPSDVRLRRQPAWGVTVELRECCWLRARVVRAFPLSDPQGPIVLLSQKGEEIGTLASLEGLDATSRAVATAEFARRYLTTPIQAILDIEGEGETLYWRVETPRGRADFVLKASRETVFTLDETRLVLVDVDGNRYEIADVRRLDARSRAVLEGII